MTNTEKKIKQLIEPIINNLGYSLYDVIYEKEGKDNYLRIFIDKEGGISINDCENVNNSITDILDEKDYIKNSYFLEVSSTGIEKRIRSKEHFEQNIGNKIEVHTYSNIENVNSKQLVGVLIKNTEDSIEIKTVENEQNIFEIRKDNISKATTVYDWEEKEKDEKKIN